MIVEPLESLIFIYALGCDACEEAIPELDRFISQNPRLMVVKVKADGPHVYSLTGMQRVKATPTYVFRRGREGFTHIGALKAKDLARWLDSVGQEESG